MSLGRAILMRMFGRPQGILGRVGGRIMAHTKGAWSARVSGLLEIAPNDCVLEIGFGPGVAIGHLSRQTRAARIVGIDASREMVEQARARNIDAIRSGRVDLRLGTVEHMPFGNNGFDKALAINSMQVCPMP
jgi:ubiquinone/menaquinone biosynthesis C-methylase UbiE